MLISEFLNRMRHSNTVSQQFVKWSRYFDSIDLCTRTRLSNFFFVVASTKWEPSIRRLGLGKDERGKQTSHPGTRSTVSGGHATTTGRRQRLCLGKEERGKDASHAGGRPRGDARQ